MNSIKSQVDQRLALAWARTINDDSPLARVAKRIATIKDCALVRDSHILDGDSLQIAVPRAQALSAIVALHACCNDDDRSQDVHDAASDALDVLVLPDDPIYDTLVQEIHDASRFAMEFNAADAEEETA